MKLVKTLLMTGIMATMTVACGTNSTDSELNTIRHEIPAANQSWQQGYLSLAIGTKLKIKQAGTFNGEHEIMLKDTSKGLCILKRGFNFVTGNTKNAAAVKAGQLFTVVGQMEGFVSANQNNVAQYRTNGMALVLRSEGGQYGLICTDNNKKVLTIPGNEANMSAIEANFSVYTLQKAQAADYSKEMPAESEDEIKKGMLQAETKPSGGYTVIVPTTHEEGEWY